MYLSITWSWSKPNKSLQVLPSVQTDSFEGRQALELHFAFHNINITGETSSSDSAMSPFTFPQTHHHVALNKKSCSGSLSSWLCSLLSNRQSAALVGWYTRFHFHFSFLCIHLVIQKKAFVCLKRWQSGVWFFPTVDVGRLPWRPTSDPGPSNLTTLPAYHSLEDKTQTEYEE